MGIAADHLERPVSQHFGNFHEACAVHGEVARRRMANVMEAEINETGCVTGILPCRANVDRCHGIPTGEDPVGRGRVVQAVIECPDLFQMRFQQHLKALHDGHRTGFPVLGIPQDGNAPLQIKVGESQGKDFILPGTG